jgi:hypothetical protein
MAVPYTLYAFLIILPFNNQSSFSKFNFGTEIFRTLEFFAKTNKISLYEDKKLDHK